MRDFRFVFPLLRAELRSYVAGVVLVLLTCVFLVSIPRLVGSAVHCMETGVREDLVVPLALAIVGAVLLRALTAFWMRRTIIGASRRIEYEIRNRLFRHLETLDRRFFVKNHTGDLINRFTSDVEAVRGVVGPGLMYSANTLFTLIVALYFMINVSATLTFYSMMPLILLTIIVRILGPRVHRESLAAQERLSDISIHAQENFSNARVVKAFSRENPEIARMEHLAGAYFRQNMRLAHLRGWIGSTLFLIGDLVVLFLIALGGPELIHGQITLGEFAEFKGVQLLLIWPMLALGWVINIFQRGAASARRLTEVFAAQPEIDDSRAHSERRVGAGAVAFSNVSFAYEPERAVLHDIGFRLEGGGTLGIVGPTGSGKTSLLQLVPRLYPVGAGEVRIEDYPVETLTLANLRDAVGYVPQEPFLFSATVAENLAFGCDDVSDDALREVARLVCIHDEVVGFRDGYEQRVGERGITLSGGQKQRIALGRALLKRPRILLLDDVLSAVDAHTEEQILSGLTRWTADLTTVIVSHRLSAVRHADEILVLDEGRVVQRGRHEDLMAVSGFYSTQYRRQTLESELEDIE